MKFDRQNNKIKDAILVANVPNTMYYGVDRGNGHIDVVPRGERGARNCSTLFVWEDRLNGYNTFSTFNDGQVLGAKLTGFYLSSSTKVYYQVTFPFGLQWGDVTYYHGYIEYSLNPNDVQAWRMVRSGEYGITVSTTTNRLNKLLEINKTIQNNNILCASIYRECQRRGVKLPDNVLSDITRLQNQIVAFSQLLEHYELIDNNKTSRYNSADLVELYDLIGTTYMGALPTIPLYAIIIGTLFLASAVSTVWLLCLRYNPPAKVALQYSDKLTADLLKYLPEDVYKKLMRENKTFEITANRVISNTAGLGTVKTVALVAGGFLLTKFIIDNYSVSKKSKKEYADYQTVNYIEQ